MKKVNMNFIAQNVAPMGAKQVAIFDSGGNLVATLPLGGLAHKHQGEKKYSFGALSDVHLPYAAQNASTDFQKALTYFNNVANVNFICISGDMSDTGTDAEWLDYKNHVDAYSPNTPVHMCTGNHDTANDITYAYPIQYTGHPLWYSFEQNNDVFIMFGLRQWQGDNVFHNEALQWLYETLEENKDKRCFVFQHEMRLDGCGNAHGLYGWDGLAGRNGQVFLSLMEHYKNVIWFHGHSHTPFRLQSTQPTPIANYDRLHGCHSVHIPSLAIPRYGNSDVIFDAEGYVVDVYENGIHLRGIDFIEEEFVPIASYWIDTTPIEIPANSYVDTRGVIKERSISLPKGSELIMNQRYSYSGKGLVTDEITPTMFTAIIPVMPNTDYVLKIKNSNIEIPSASSSVVYGLDSSKISAQQINGGNIPSMTTGITLSEDKKSADITFTTAGNVSYIALSLKAISSGTLKESDIVDYVIEIEQSGNNDQPENAFDGFSTDLLQTYEVKLNQRWSASSNGYVDQNGTLAFSVPFADINGRTIKMIGFEPENGGLSTWYVYNANKTRVGRISNSSTGIIWTLDSLRNNGDGSYEVDISSEIFFSTSTGGPITFEPDIIMITMWVKNDTAITSTDDLSMLISDKVLPLTQGEITNEVTWTMDKRLSSVGDPDKDGTGSMVSNHILVNPGDAINIYGIASLNPYLYVNFYNNETFLYNIPLSNPGCNPTDHAYAYAEYATATQHLMIQTKDTNTFNSIRICCPASTVTVYRNAEQQLDPIALPEGTELYLNQRYSATSGEFVTLNGVIAVLIPLEYNANTTYKLKVENLPYPNMITTTTDNTLYAIDSSKTKVGNLTGDYYHLSKMSKDYITLNEDETSFEIECMPVSGMTHSALSLTIKSDVLVTEEDLKGIVITLTPKI